MKCFLDTEKLSEPKRIMLITWVIKMLPHVEGRGFVRDPVSEKWRVDRFIGIDYNGLILDITHSSHDTSYKKNYPFYLIDDLINTVLSNKFSQNEVVKLNDENTAIVTNEEVKVGCQSFSFEAIKALARAVQDVEDRKII